MEELKLAFFCYCMMMAVYFWPTCLMYLHASDHAEAASYFRGTLKSNHTPSNMTAANDILFPLPVFSILAFA